METGNIHHYETQQSQHSTNIRIMELLSSIAGTPSQPLLFIVSFLAATILPLGSEWLLIVMISQGFALGETIIIATIGNYLGSCTTYAIGQYGSEYIINKLLRISVTQQNQAKKLYEKYGSWSLFLAWLPVVGDPICLIAGIFKVHWLRFSILVFLGKFSRYATVAYLSHKALIN
ncbi:YqaA family protein [Desulforhopalus sp. 52FAK]